MANPLWNPRATRYNLAGTSGTVAAVAGSGFWPAAESSITGTLASVTDSITAALSGTVASAGITGVISSTVDPASASFSGATKDVGTFAAIADAAALLSGAVKDVGSIASATTLAASFSGAVKSAGSIASTPGATASFSGATKGVGSITSATDNLIAAFSGEVLSAGISGVFSVVLAPASAAFAASVATQGNISSLTAASNSSLIGVVESAGTIQSQAENAVAFLNGFVAGPVSGTLSATTDNLAANFQGNAAQPASAFNPYNDSIEFVIIPHPVLSGNISSTTESCGSSISGAVVGLTANERLALDNNNAVAQIVAALMLAA